MVRGRRWRNRSPEWMERSHVAESVINAVRLTQSGAAESHAASRLRSSESCCPE